MLDGVDEEFDSRVKYAFKLRSKLFEDQCRLFFAKNLADKQLWLRSFHEERNIAEGDKFGKTNVFVGRLGWKWLGKQGPIFKVFPSPYPPKILKVFLVVWIEITMAKRSILKL